MDNVRQQFDNMMSRTNMSTKQIYSAWCNLDERKINAIEHKIQQENEIMN